jgi:hypothetical protein
VQTFGGSINSGSQTGRPSTHNGQIIEGSLRSRSQPDLLRHIRRGTLEKLRTVGEEDHGQIGSLGAESLEKALSFGIIGRKLDINPLIRNVIAR